MRPETKRRLLGPFLLALGATCSLALVPLWASPGKGAGLDLLSRSGRDLTDLLPLPLLQHPLPELEAPINHNPRQANGTGGSLTSSLTRIKRKGRILRLKLPHSHLRPSEMGIPVGEALAPPLCPPPPVTRSQGICQLQKCSSHQDCDGGQACCFNGCIRACTQSMDQPAAFDWIEDTSQILPILDIEFEESPEPFYPILIESKPPQYAAAEAEEELVHLPGGCYVSASRYRKLKEFMEAPSIKDCRCTDGEVVCDVRTEKT